MLNILKKKIVTNNYPILFDLNKIIFNKNMFMISTQK